MLSHWLFWWKVERTLQAAPLYHPLCFMYILESRQGLGCFHSQEILHFILFCELEM